LVELKVTFVISPMLIISILLARMTEIRIHVNKMVFILKFILLIMLLLYS
jgi:hypothetical protein